MKWFDTFNGYAEDGVYTLLAIFFFVLWCVLGSPFALIGWCSRKAETFLQGNK